MAWATLNGADVVWLRLLVPRTGVWLADLTVVTDTAPQGPAVLGLVEGASTWKGTVLRSDVAFGRCSLRLVGGGGGLGKSVAGKSYRSTTARVVLGDILAAAGEKLSPAVATGLLGAQLGAWSRCAGLASAQLGALLGAVAPAASWRVLPDGSWWAGAETWPAASPAYELLEQSPPEGCWLVATSDVHQLLPGTTLEGRRVSAVEHVIDADRMRSSVWFER